MTRTIGLVLALALLGCTPVWKHPSKGEDDYHKDIHACNTEASALLLKEMEKRGHVHNCMRAKGWRDERAK